MIETNNCDIIKAIEEGKSDFFIGRTRFIVHGKTACELKVGNFGG